MITVRNKKKKVIILQAPGVPILRLAPGDNYVDVDSAADLKAYVEGNVAAKARFDKDLALISSGEENAAEAQAAKEKNDLLNKAQETIAVIQRESDVKGEENAELKATLSEMEKQMKTLMAKIKKLEKEKE